MSDQRIPISQLVETQTAPDASYIAIDDGSLTKKITVENFNSTSTASAQQYANQAAASAQTVEDNIATSAAQIREATLAAREATQASTAATASATSAYDSASLAQNYSANASTSAGQAMNAADSSAQNLTASKGYAEDSEAWAVGKRNGTDVPASDETYQNNAKYYANSASGSAARAEAAAQSINVPDTTLTVSGVAADSKTTGDRISAADAELADIRVKADGTTASTAGNAVREQFTELKNDLDDTQDKIKRLDNGIGTLDGNFVIGSLDKTTVYPNNKYTVCNPTIQQYNRDIVFTIKPGFKINVNFFDSEGERTAAYGNRTGTFTVPKDTRFNLSIRRNPEDTSEVITDIDEFVNAVIFHTAIDDRIVVLETDSSQYKDNFGDISDDVTSETLSFEYGNIENGTGIIKNGTYVRTRFYIKACAGDVISAKYINYNNNPTGVQLNGYEYDEYGALIGGASAGWKNSYTVTKDCNLHVLFNNNLSIESSTSRAVSPSEFKEAVTINYVRNNFVINGSLIDLRSNETIKSITNTFLSNTVRTIAHRGDDIVAPQNTAPAYIEARRRGILIAENDVFISSDNVYVMWHDSSLSKLGNLVDVNGYLVYTNGTDFYYYDATNETLYTYSDADDEYVQSLVDVSSLTRCAGADYSVTDLTYAVLKRIDFGAYKNEQYKGTHILTFGEWVLLCKQLGMSLYIDSKITFRESDLTALMGVVKNMGMVSYATWINVPYSLMSKLRELDPSARVGLLSNPTQELINAYSAYLADGEVFFDGSATGLTSASAALALSNGFGLECYYVDFGNKTPENVYEQIRSFVALGITGITIDHYRVDEAFQYLFTTN